MTSVISRLRPDETSTPRGGSASGGPTGIALLPIGADLLPRQAAVGRGGRGTRYAALGIVVLVLLGITGAYAWSVHARSSAQTALATAQDQQLAAQHRQRGFTDLVRTQAQAKALRTSLASLMATDAPWSSLLTNLARVHGGVTFTSVSGSVDDPRTAAATGGATGTVTTAGAIGSLTVSGTAPDKPTIAAFVDALGSVPGLADPFLSTVTELTGTTGATGYSFTVAVALTGDLRSAANRWATTTGGGK